MTRNEFIAEAAARNHAAAINGEDATAEGFVGHESANVDGAVLTVTPTEQFLDGFRALNKLAADADPWLWVVEFERAAP